LCIFLIGSITRPYWKLASDIDIAIITTLKPKCNYLEIRFLGDPIGIEFFYVSDLRTKLKNNQIDYKDLREIGRLAAGNIIFSSNENRVDSLKKEISKAELSPKYQFNYFKQAYLFINKIEQSNYNELEMSWDMIGLIFVASIIYLNTTPYKFQKPKWIYQDLRIANEFRLSGILSQYIKPKNVIDIPPIVKKMAEIFRNYLKSIGLPPLLRGDNPNSNYGYLYMTYKDAKKLLESNYHLSAFITMIFTARLLETYLKNEGFNEEHILSFRHETIQALQLNTKSLIDSKFDILKAVTVAINFPFKIF
jgi:hypothetical protein